MSANRIKTTSRRAQRPGAGRESVLMVGAYVGIARGSRQISEGIGERLAKAGWRIHFVSRRQGRLARLKDMLRSTWTMRHEYCVAHIDLFSGPAFWWGAAVCLALKWLGKPFVVTLHGGSLPEFSRRFPRAVGRVLHSAVVVTSPSAYLQSELRRFRADIRLIPNPVNVADHVFRLREALEGKILWVRAFDAIYNPMLAPRILALLAGQFPAVTLTMIGPDKGDGSFQKTKDIAANLGVNGKIDFVGSVRNDEIPSWLSRHEILLNTTTVDNVPVSVLEAMSNGLCVVSTDVGGVPFVIENEKEGLLVPSGDPAAMARAVTRLLQDSTLASELSRNARRRVEQCDWSKILPLWESLFKEIVASHS
jgi:glycosyltransferase involved in cell wall biosynthesis